VKAPQPKREAEAQAAKTGPVLLEEAS